ncbi:MAG: hypothetical protein HQL39_07520 [Alphaproteobacteria bacterium]|nr:hypothetical protein [Alphaproteobacteria bacterium]
MRDLPQAALLTHADSEACRAIRRDLEADGWSVSDARDIDAAATPGLLVLGLGPCDFDSVETLIRAFAQVAAPGALVVGLLEREAWTPSPASPLHAAGQAGLWALLRSLALTMAPGLRINAVAPNGAPTPDLCRALRFVLAAPAMTGQMIALDGPIGSIAR